MNSFNDVIKELLPNLTVEKKFWLQQLEQNEELNLLIKTNNIPEEVLISSLTQLYQYLEEKGNCSNCTGLDQCPNLLKGHFTSLEYINEQFYSTLTKCDKQKQMEHEELKNRLFRSQYIPHNMLKVTFKNIDQTKGREDAFTALLEFCLAYQANSNQKGIYLYGPLGVGKSHMMAAAANKLAEKGVSTLMVYVPDFFREMKSSIQDNTINEKIEALKEVEVLILDDIGAETISQWERDEILGAILQARMIKGLPTLYTSNLDYDDLEEHLAYSNKGGEEGLKAKRIMERIRHFTTPYFVDGPNRRMS